VVAPTERFLDPGPGGRTALHEVLEPRTREGIGDHVRSCRDRRRPARIEKGTSLADHVIGFDGGDTQSFARLEGDRINYGRWVLEPIALATGADIWRSP
jgi:hypothetical protein